MREWFNAPVNRRLKNLLWCLAWGMVILTTLAIKPADVLTAPFFPVGLLGFLRGGEPTAMVAWMLGFPIVFGWLIYILISAAMFRAGRNGTFILIYIVLCALLAVNVVGCHRTLEAASHIH